MPQEHLPSQPATVRALPPAYLAHLRTPQDVDAAQTRLVAFMKARGLRVRLVRDQDGRPVAEYDPFVEANIDAVQAFYDSFETSAE